VSEHPLQYVATLIIGAVVGIALDRLKSVESRRTAAWDQWVNVNEAVRSGDIVKVNPAIGRWERALQVARVPKAVFRCAEITSAWYTTWFSFNTPGGPNLAPEPMYAMHQAVVDRLRSYLQRPWWRPRNPFTPANRRLLRALKSEDPEVVAVLEQLRSEVAASDEATPGVG
jgi:hypothetical protein